MHFVTQTLKQKCNKKTKRQMSEKQGNNLRKRI